MAKQLAPYRVLEYRRLMKDKSVLEIFLAVWQENNNPVFFVDFFSILSLPSEVFTLTYVQVFVTSWEGG